MTSNAPSATGSEPVRGTQAIDRAAAMIATVVRADEPLSFAEVQEEVDLPKSTTSRLLSALERTDLLERDETGGYVAGPLFWLYAARHDPWDELVRLAMPTLEQIGEETKETVHLAMARDERVVHIAQVDSQFMLGMRDWADADVPAHTSALGKVLFAHGELEIGRRKLNALTERTITDPVALRAECERIRRRGWAATIDELEVGLSGVAVPLFGRHGNVFAAIGVSGPTARLKPRTAQIAEQLNHRAGQLTRLLSRRNRKEGAA